MARYYKMILFDNLGYFSPYRGFWIHRDYISFDNWNYTLSEEELHPHDPDSTLWAQTIFKSNNLKEVIDKAKELYILELEQELNKLKEND